MSKRKSGKGMVIFGLVLVLLLVFAIGSPFAARDGWFQRGGDVAEICVCEDCDHDDCDDDECECDCDD